MEANSLNVICPGIENGKFRLGHTGRGQDRSPELILEGHILQSGSISGEFE